VSDHPDFRPAVDPSRADVSRRVPQNNPRAEGLVAALLMLAALCGLGFIVAYALRGLDTELLGLAFGLLLALLAAAAIIAGKRVVVQETAIEDRPPLLESDVAQQTGELIEHAADGISRRALLAGASGVAGFALAGAAAAPIASLGPTLSGAHTTPWRRGVLLIDEQGRAYSAAQIETGAFYTALPQGADPEALGSGVLVVKLPPELIKLPPQRLGWAPGGILAYSKICTHASCAVSLYRYPTYAPTSTAQPAFTCPCHYSTFLPGEGGRVSFGPAGRPLPQLPLMIDSLGYLRAAGGFDGDVGPAWLDVRRPNG
jgi:ubiquinol-cytochrome c reductase iron-sulfur subunit